MDACSGNTLGLTTASFASTAMGFRCHDRYRQLQLVALVWSAAVFCCQPCCGDGAESDVLQLFIATSPSRFQDAIRAGVKHIVLTEHMDMTAVRTEIDMDPAEEALSTAVGRVAFTTRSIVVRRCALNHCGRSCVRKL